MIERVIDPIAFRIGPLQVHWYGIIIATAVLVAGLLGTREARRRGEDPEQGWSMLLLVIVTSVIAARAYHVIHMWSYYSQHLELIPQVWLGGIGIPGAVAGGAFGIWLYCRWNHLNTARWLDIFAPALLLGQAIGRLGNFVNQELYGPPTTLPWGIPIDAAHRLGTDWDPIRFPVATTRFVPLFAYEAILNLIGMAVVLYIAHRFAKKLYDGDIALIYIIWYGAVRSALETFRVNNWVILEVPTAIWIGTIGILLAAGFLVLRHAKHWGIPGAWMDRSGTDAEAPASTNPEPQPG